jgi:hypothetical protein
MDSQQASAVSYSATKTSPICTVATAETVGDCTYGDGDTRRIFADAGRRLVAQVPPRRGQAYFPKDDWRIDLETMTSTCLGGQATQTRDST